MSTTTLVALILVPLTVLIAFHQRSRSSIRHIRGPPSPSWFYGHMRQLTLAPTYGYFEFQWLKAFGPVYRFKGCFGQNRLMVSDPVAFQYIFNSPHFALSPTTQNTVALVFGEGNLMGIRGKLHKRLRNEFNAAFTAAAVRGYFPIFEKVAQAISQELEAKSSAAEESQEVIDVVPLLNAVTLGAIAEAALGCTAEDLGSEYVAANAEIMAAASNQSPLQLLADALLAFLPSSVLRLFLLLPTKTLNAARKSNTLARSIGSRVIGRKEELMKSGVDVRTDVFGGLLDPERTETKLTRDEIITQTPIVMVAGQETTTNTLSFGLWELAKNPTLQDSLRAEIHQLSNGGNFAYDKMPLLNAFIKEALRFYPSEAFTERMVTRDTVLPLSESITTSTGEEVKQIPLQEGQVVVVGVASYQRIQSRWGEDAHEFRPSRWLEGSIAKGDAVGPYANLLSFLGGPHTCLGWRFAIMEMQVVLCELVGKFSFSLSEEHPIRVGIANTLQPTMRDGGKGVPLKVARVL